MLKHLKKRGLAVLLSGGLLLSQVSVYARTTETGLCEHHPAHTAECGYTDDNSQTSCAFLCELCNPETEEDMDASAEQSTESGTETVLPDEQSTEITLPDEQSTEMILPDGQPAEADPLPEDASLSNNSGNIEESVAVRDASRTREHHFTKQYDDLLAWMKTNNVQDGDTIVLDAEPYVGWNSQEGEPQVIATSVTIQAGTADTIHFRSAGIILGADVTFKNVFLGFQNRTRSAIMANGHTLTLENVVKNAGTRDIHLLCGSLTGYSTNAAPGTHGQIVIRGNTSLGNIYAGSLSSDGSPNHFDYPATITIENSAAKQMGNIYASGAKQAFVDQDQMLNPYYEPDPPTADPGQYVTNGDVTINTYGSISRSIDGRTGGSKNAAVIYNGNEYLNDRLILSNIRSLSVQSGKLTPASGSSFADDNADVSAASGTQLSLVNFDKNLTTGSFTGGGIIILDPKQSWKITGAVAEATTKIAVGDIWLNASTSIPQKNHPYIVAPASRDTSFQLIPHNANPQQILYRNNQGIWMAGTADQLSIKINSLSMPADFSLPASNYGAEIPVTVDYSSAKKGIVSIPVSINVNGVPTTPSGNEATGFSYHADGLGTLEFAETDDGEFLIITGTGALGAVTSGSYRIDCTIPAAYMADNQDCTIRTALTVPSEGSGSLKVFNGDRETTVFSYGDTITVKFTLPSGQPADGGKQASLYYGDRLLAASSSADSGGTFTLIHNTGSSDTIPASDFANGTQQTLRVSYGETVDSASASITLNPKTVTASVTNTITKPYDATTDAAVSLGIRSDDYVRKGDSITLTASGTYDQPNAGADKPVTVTISTTSGVNHEAYHVTPPVHVTGTITKAQTAAPNAPELASRTADSITLKAAAPGVDKADAEYSIDNGKSWQPGRTFGNLSPGTSYTFLARYPETENYLASAASASATFQTDQKRYMVTVLTNGNGTASASPTSSAAGTQIRLTATPDNGHHFVRWDTVSGNVTVSQNTFVMPSHDVTVRAVFAKNSTPPNNGLDSDSLSGKPKFIALLYENTLGRHPSQSEIDHWEQQLSQGKTGADTAYGFLFSEEFRNKNYNNSDYVEHLYLSLMGRPSDPSGKQGWAKRLDDGMSRTYVFSQFVNSVEFANLCSAYGIERGGVTLTEERDRNYDVTRFVARNYTQFLGRAYEADGLNYWTEFINSRTRSMQDIALGFVFSPECTNKNLSDHEFAAMLYRGCFDREGDTAGIQYWVEKLRSGEMDRLDVFYGFANSQEFANMVKSYGL